MDVEGLNALTTPCLLLDRRKLHQNLWAMAGRASVLGVKLRPHVKTHKSAAVLREVIDAGETAGITVSTLQEAEYFFAEGVTDIFYAVGMTPNKVAQAAKLIAQGCDLSVTTDSLAMAALLNETSDAQGVQLPVVIELDVDGHRSGITPDSDALTQLATAIDRAPALILKGVMAHAGESYNCGDIEAIAAMARQERDLTVASAQRIRSIGLDCPVVSVGSTPTALTVDNLSGISEFRPGVYTFMDLFQAGLGVACPDDIALSVVTTVIGHQAEKSWVIVDAGWMAMSRDRSTASQIIDQGYGLVCDASGHVLEDVIISEANQEHGIITARAGQPGLDLGRFPVGTTLRILPNHACATAGQFSGYHVLDEQHISDFWSRTTGW